MLDIGNYLNWISQWLRLALVQIYGLKITTYIHEYNKDINYTYKKGQLLYVLLKKRNERKHTQVNYWQNNNSLVSCYNMAADTFFLHAVKENGEVCKG